MAAIPSVGLPPLTGRGRRGMVRRRIVVRVVRSKHCARSAGETLILRCALPRLKDGTRVCGGLIGGVPDGAVALEPLKRIEGASPGNFAMRCEACHRWIEIRPPGSDCIAGSGPDRTTTAARSATKG